MDLLRQFITETIIEGKLENETTAISRQLIDRIRTNIERHGGMKRGFTVELKKLPESLNLVWVKAKVYFDPSLKEPLVAGEYRYDDSYGEKYGAVNLDISVPSSWKDVAAAKQQYSALVTKTKNILRHELEHSDQSSETLKSVPTEDFNDIEELRKYMMHPAEIMAYVVGMYKEAKMNKRPLKDVFDDKMRGIIQVALEFGADKEKEIIPLVRDLFSAWREYAMKRLPKAKI